MAIRSSSANGLSDYWSRRKELTYFRVAADYVRKHSRGNALLEVGGGVSLGCRYLDLLPEFDRTSIELPSGQNHILPGVRVIHADFLTWQADHRYDVLLALQTIEHIGPVEAFVEKLFALAPVVVLSVPYEWPAGKCQGHLHDPIDERKLRLWTVRDPIESRIVDRRLVAVYGSPEHAAHSETMPLWKGRSTTSANTRDYDGVGGRSALAARPDRHGHLHRPVEAVCGCGDAEHAGGGYPAFARSFE